MSAASTPGCSTEPAKSGRQESNLPVTAYQTVASPLGFGPNRAPCTGIEPVSPVRQTGWHASFITGLMRASGGSRTRLSTLARGCLDRSATDASRNRPARAEGVEPSACGLEPHYSPRSTPLSKSAAQAGLEPATVSLTASRSTIELQGNRARQFRRLGSNQRPPRFQRGALTS